MKKYWLIALLIAGGGAVASAVLWMSQPTPCASDWLAKELKLTPAQQTQLATLDRDFSGHCDKYCEEMCAARVALAQELERVESVTPKVEQLLAKMQTAQAASERQTLEHLFRIKSILSPEQQRRYVELITGKLCANCPQGTHRPAHQP